MTAEEARKITVDIEPQKIQQEIDALMPRIEAAAKDGMWNLTLNEDEHLRWEISKQLKSMGYTISCDTVIINGETKYPLQIWWTPPYVHTPAPAPEPYSYPAPYNWIRKLIKSIK